MERVGLEGEAVATRAEKTGVAISGGVDAFEELMCRVGAAAVMTLGAVLVSRCDWHTRACGLANVQRRTVAAKYINRRPFRQDRNCRRRVRTEFLDRVNDFSTDDCKNGLDALDSFFRHGKI